MTETAELLDLQVFPFGGSSYLGPDPTFERLRTVAPVARVRTNGGVDAWMISRYAEARAALGDPRLSRAAACAPGAPKVGGAMYTTPEMIISMDTTEHARLRKLVVRGFTTRRVAMLRERVQEVVDDILDEMAADGGPVDLVDRLTLPLPLTVIGELLGVPAQDLRDFEGWARAFATVDDRAGGETSLEGLAKLNEYIVGLVAAKRANPQDDMLSELVAARDESDRLSEQELVTFGFTLIGAGFDTTANQLANSVLALLGPHRDQWDWLVRHPEQLDGAVEELLRRVNLFATDTTGFHRIATEDLEIGGSTIRAGEVVLISLSSANRDRDVFPDPDALDLSRSKNPHLSFGHGVHHCLGAQLGRLEMQVALEGLTRRFPSLRLALDEDQLPWYSGEINHTLKELPVVWDTTTATPRFSSPQLPEPEVRTCPVAH